MASQVGQSDKSGILLVGKENLLHLFCHVLTIEEDVTLEIILKTAKINIGRTTRAHGIIAHQHLGMQKTGLVEIDLHTCLHHFRQVGTARPLHNLRITAKRQHQAHIHTRECSRETTDDKGQEYTAEAVINQKGSIQEMSIADFLLEPTENNNSLYRITGVITSIANPTYGNVYIRDWSGEVYVYGIGAKGFFETTGLKVGDVVTLVGKRAVYKGTDQLSNTTLEDYKTVTPMTIDEFLDQEDNPNVYYMLTGNITEVANATYGNLTFGGHRGKASY